jgi:hypothetical protein
MNKPLALEILLGENGEGLLTGDSERKTTRDILKEI